MFSYVYAILQSENPKYMFLQLLFLMAILYLVIIGYKNLVKPVVAQEGFHQNEAYVIKRNHEAYDDFYADVYDELNDTQPRCENELIEIIRATEPTTQNSVFLDVGSGTGHTVNQLQVAGYRAYGIDKSRAMVDHSDKLHPETECKCGDIADPMAFDKSTFSHILCTHFTIYQLEDKARFFQNCYFWMKPNAYLILHLVDVAKFDTTTPIDNKTNLWKPLQRLYGERPMETNVEFADYKYKAVYTFPKPDAAVLTETFTDKDTNHVRQNELALSMEPLNKILECAKKCGFLVHAKINMTKCGGTDKYQYLYVLERPL